MLWLKPSLETKDEMIIHIPHASTRYPKEFYRKELDDDIYGSLDTYADEIFRAPEIVTVMSKYSRVWCDVERFENDEMEQEGRGMIYTRDRKGVALPERAENDIRKAQLYYHDYHRGFANMVELKLKRHYEVIIFDCHTFYQEDGPDIDIGTDPFHTAKWIEDFTRRYWEEQGRVLMNDPYAGSLVPYPLYKKNSAVKSIMIEINRKFIRSGV